ncbi:hypothetical protein ACOZ4N_06160 [Halorientalis pallida]|uniref:hypothetical protein n=1 Tax=Halorientalis pallida TaxID=2479928 RepID=UPI003C70008D
MTKDAQVNIYLDQEQKDRWDKYKEESSKVSSMAELIRSAVELYIETDGGRESVGGAVTGDVNLGGVETELKGIQNRLDDLETTIDTVRREVESDEVDASLQQAVLRSLPKRSELNDGERGAMAGEVANSVDAGEREVAKALDILDETTPNVQSRVFEEGGRRLKYYWKQS